MSGEGGNRDVWIDGLGVSLVIIGVTVVANVGGAAVGYDSSRFDNLSISAPN